MYASRRTGLKITLLSIQMATDLHNQRLDVVVGHLLASGARRVVDLGCGDGELLLRLCAHAQFDRLVGIDLDETALRSARRSMQLGFAQPSDRLQVHRGSFETSDPDLADFDAATLVETIEHIEPNRLSRVENAVFGGMRPRMILVTTPNQEYNVLHGIHPGRMRHPGHRFEWGRAKFRQWARGVAARNAYQVAFYDIGDPHPALGGSTQMARFAATGRSARAGCATADGAAPLPLRG